MEKNLISKNNSHIIVIFLGLFLSIALSTYYVSKYDKYLLSNNDHQLIKDETLYHWIEGAKIAKEVRQGKNFFLSGDKVFTKPLQQRIIGLYSLITGYELADRWEQSNPRVSLEGKLPYLILQSLFYFFSVYYFSKRIIKIMPKRAFLFTILFLCLEPTMFQYHSSFWTESIYFSLQLIIFGMLLEKRINFSYNLLIGFLIGILFLQRSGGIFYIFPILLCSFFLFRKKIVNVLLGMISGFTIILILLGSYNFYKTKEVYILPAEGKYSVFIYFSILVAADKLNISPAEVMEIEADKSLQWIRDNNIKLDDKASSTKIKSPFKLLPYFLNEKEKLKFYDYIQTRQYALLLDSPLTTVKKVIIQTMHLVILNPIHVYYYNTYRGLNKGDVEFFKSQKHKSWIPFRIGYTLTIYIFCLMGFVALYKKKQFYEFYLITLSVLYYVSIFGWYGNTRLFAPSLIYLSVFFGVGIDLFLNRFKKFS